MEQHEGAEIAQHEVNRDNTSDGTAGTGSSSDSNPDGSGMSSNATPEDATTQGLNFKTFRTVSGKTSLIREVR